MPCYRPIVAWYGDKLSSGKREIVFSRGQAQSCLDLKLPCGSCVGCRLERARQWAMRCVDEASLYLENSFITLTFNEEHLPLNRSLDVCIFQKFMKRLRKEVSPVRIRFFHCGEYGPKNGRPHYHSLIFNYGFPDRVYFGLTSSGEKIYRSVQLERVWPFGYSSVADLTFGSAAYVARYHLKKVGSVVSDNHYVNKKSGEVLSPEYVTMSRRPGIGAGWFKKFKSDVYPFDSRVIKGIDTKPCKYYDSLYEVSDPESFRDVKLERLVCAAAQKDDNTEDRLLVKEQVKLAQISNLRSSLEDI